MKVQIGTEYSAMEIAEYAVSRRYRHDTPISNLQLQKILYFLQVIHASETGELLFADQFEAWPYGPVIRDVYVEFSDCGGFPIKREFDTEINDSIRPFLDAGTCSPRNPHGNSSGSHTPRGPRGTSSTTRSAYTRESSQMS